MHPHNSKEYYFLSEVKEQGHFLNGALLKFTSKAIWAPIFQQTTYSPAISRATLYIEAPG